MSETQNLKLVYKDEDGEVFCHILDDGKLVLHSQYNTELTPSFLKKAVRISQQIDTAFKEKGVKCLHTWATNKDEENYNQFLGYVPTGLEIFMEGYEGPPILEYYKEL